MMSRRTMWLVGLASYAVAVLGMSWFPAPVESGSSKSVSGTPGALTMHVSFLAQSENQPAEVIGVARANCKKCHPSETAAWMKTAHFASTDKLLRFSGNTQKYAEALGISAENLMADSVCADCHGTKAVVDGRVEVISGVSCESCHGASGGTDGWLNRHQSYHPDRPATRSEETEEHRIGRLADCDAAGMVRSENLAGIARNCLSCHLISNEKLVAAGHKANSQFDFASWTSGEIRHNFFIDKDNNADAPTLWMERTGKTAAERKRLKFVVGVLTTLEMALRKRAEMSNPSVIPQMGGFAAAVNGKLSQINAVAMIPETKEAAELFAPMLGTIFAPLPTDKETYSEAAGKIAALTETFLQSADASKLQALDAIIATTPPHYSQHYQQNSAP